MFEQKQMQSKRHMKYANFGNKNNSVQENTSMNSSYSLSPYKPSLHQIQDQKYWQESPAGHPKKSAHQHHAASVLDMQRYKLKVEDSSRSPYK